jgi:rhodanese-related sulfurtransferase
LNDLIANGVPFPPSSHLVIFCATGSRSLLAAESLIKRGYPLVHNLDGGLSGWRRAFPA